MISFIIIGYNEEKFLKKCIESVVFTIKENKIPQYEIIYIDSDSDDKSVEIALTYPDVSVYKIVGKCNAADARNTGAHMAKGTVYFFIDGDMEIMPGFIPLVFTKDFVLTYPFCSGQFENQLYNNKGKFLKKKLYYSDLKRDRYESTTGGLFVVDRELWELVNGMKSKYRRSQDLDFGLRMSRAGYKLLRKKELMALHHTVDYKNKYRMWKDLFKGNTLYARGVLYRDHLFNKYVYKRIIFSDGSTVLLLVLSILSIILNKPLLVLIYFPVLSLLILTQGNIMFIDWLIRIPYYFIRDVFTIISFFGFYPKGNNHFKCIYQNDKV